MLVKLVAFIVSNKRVAALTSAMVLCPPAAEACSWPEGYRLAEATVIDRFCEADSVFVGEVESTLSARDQVLETKIWPKKTLKGQTSSPTYALDSKLETRAGRYCGFPFERTGRYLIFADRYEDTNYLCVSSCDLTQTFNPQSFTYRVITSLSDVKEVCSEEASQRRRAQHRGEWVKRFSEKDQEMAELYELTREQQKANEASSDRP